MVTVAHITSYPMLRHLRGTSTQHVRHLRGGKVAHDGTGLSFFFRPLSAVISEVPVDDRELPLLFHARTADFQDLTVQASVTFRVTDPATACARIDFSVDPDTGRWRGTPLEQVGGLLTETAQQQVLGLIARSPLAGLLAEGVEQVRDRILHGLTDDARLAETGIAVIGARVIAIRPEPDVEKALRTPARERIQADADRATYDRRALAVELERSIAENELKNQIELARREEQLIAQRGANARNQATEAAAAKKIETHAQATRDQLLADAAAHRARVLGAAKAAGEEAQVAIYRDLPQATLLGLAAREVAGKLPPIGSLVLTPDLLAPVLAKLGARTPGTGSAGAGTPSEGIASTGTPSPGTAGPGTPGAGTPGAGTARGGVPA
jgi:regulator of protease activity HflC (stomatin/prohibitin superfamily)